MEDGKEMKNKREDSNGRYDKHLLLLSLLTEMDIYRLLSKAKKERERLLIKRETEVGIKTLREIALEHNCSHITVRNIKEGGEIADGDWTGLISELSKLSKLTTK